MKILNNGSFDPKSKPNKPLVPVCTKCKKPFTQCRCKDNDLKKGRPNG
jgi:hypothetical protein